MEVTLNRHIDITPDVRGGKPRIAGTRITVADVVIMHRRMGQFRRIAFSRAGFIRE